MATQPELSAPYAEPMFDGASFGRRIRVAMAEDNLSLRALQGKIGVDQASLHRCAVKEKCPSVEVYLRLSRWLEDRNAQQVQP